MSQIAEAKVCSRCRVLKTLDNYTGDRWRKDGRNHRCRSCVKEVDAIRDATPERVERSRIRLAQIKHPPEQIWARNRLQAALNKGLVQKWPACAIPDCSEKKVEAHHPDYSAPIDVIWLCGSHHRQAHALVRKGHRHE